ncbi:uncharacterized protein [Clytia hemisphaerica]
MRIGLQHLPLATVILSPFIVSYNGYGLFMTTFTMLLCFLIYFVTNYYLTFKRVGAKEDRIVLNTFPISHYVEKARWCLDKSGIPYTEEKDIGVFWFILTGRMLPTLRNETQNITIPNTSDICKYLYGHTVQTQGEEKAEFLKPSTKGFELEKKIDRIGLLLRRYAYYHMIVDYPDNMEMIALKGWGFHEETVPSWQKMILKIVWPLNRIFVINALQINKKNVEKDRKRIDDFYREMDEILSNNKYLLGTDEPTYIDITFAAITSLIVWPKEYGGPRLTPAARLEINDFGPEPQKRMNEFRETVSGQFVLRMYREHRI